MLHRICKTDHQLGKGTYKTAFATKKCVESTEEITDWTSSEPPNKLCIVEFKNKIRWVNPLTASDEIIKNSIEEFAEFKKKLKSDPAFDRGVYKIISKTSSSDKLREVMNIIKDYGNYFGSTKHININDLNPNTIKLLEKWYGISDDQFEITNELKKMHELNKIGITTNHSGGGAPPDTLTQLAPMLYQIRIDTLEIEPDRRVTKVNMGIPFSPDEIDSKFSEIINESVIKISYLVEKCGMSIKSLVQMVNYDKFSKIGEKIIEFIDTCVDLTHELNCDFKPENLCPQYNSIDEIESLSLLDIDAKFYIKNDDVEFQKNAKVFMKFMIFSYFAKYSQKIFPDWGISENDVREMLKFFYQDTYMIYRYNPINMIWHYMDGTNPANIFDNYEFMYHDEIKKHFPSEEKLISSFEHTFIYIRPKSAPEGSLSSILKVPKPFPKMEGGKSKKHKKKTSTSRRRRKN